MSMCNVFHPAANFDAPQVSVKNLQANLNQNSNYPLMSGSATLPNRRSTGQNVSESCRQEVGGGNSDPVSANSLKTPGCSTADKTFLFESPLSLMNRANTKKIGRKIRVQLQKGEWSASFATNLAAVNKISAHCRSAVHALLKWVF